MKRNIVVVNGPLGSGKSSTAKGVSKKLEYTHFSSGDIFREIAKEHGVSVEEINLIAEDKIDIDHEVDEKLRHVYENMTDIVIDSRMAAHWMPEAFRVYLNLDPHIAAERIFNQIQEEGRESQSASSVEEVLKNTEIRLASEKKRYRSLYNFDPFDTENYNIVIDTQKNNLEEVIEIVVSEYKKWLES